MKRLILEAVRDTYSTNQINYTMTVGDLISLLSDFDEDTPVYLSHDNGYTFGAVRNDRFTEEEDRKWYVMSEITGEIIKICDSEEEAEKFMAYDETEGLCLIPENDN